MARGPVRQHWWQNPRALLPVFVAVWCLAAAMALTIGWFLPDLAAHTRAYTVGDTTYLNTDAEGTPAEVADVFTLILLPVEVIGLIAQGLYGERTGTGPVWGLTYLFAIPAAGIGIGAAIRYGIDGRFSALMILLAVLGLAIGSIQWTTLVLGRRRARVQERVSRTGERTTATVKRVSVSTNDGIHSWKTWLEFRDARGDSYHITRLEKFLGSSHTPKVGDEYSISYDPDRPGARSRVVVHGPHLVSAGASRRTRFVHWRGPAPQ